MSGSVKKGLLVTAGVLVLAYAGSGLVLRAWSESLIEDAARSGADAAAGAAVKAEALGVQPWRDADSPTPLEGTSPLHSAQSAACDTLGPLRDLTLSTGCAGIGTSVDGGEVRITYVFEPWLGLPFDYGVSASAHQVADLGAG